MCLRTGTPSGWGGGGEAFVKSEIRYVQVGFDIRAKIRYVQVGFDIRAKFCYVQVGFDIRANKNSLCHGVLRYCNYVSFLYVELYLLM